MLAQRFHSIYPLAEGTEFREIDNPHCWKAEYVHVDERPLCRFQVEVGTSPEQHKAADRPDLTRPRTDAHP